MKIALYGSQDEVKQREDKLRCFLQASEYNVQIDIYKESALLLENMFQYDIICMTDEAVDMIIGGSSNQVMFEWGKKIRTCRVEDIYYAEADLKNVHIWFENEEMLVHIPFSRVEQILNVGDFIKVHRSYLVNCRYIHSIDENVVTLKDGSVLPLSKYRSEKVREQYTEYMKKKGIALYTKNNIWKI